MRPVPTPLNTFSFNLKRACLQAFANKRILYRLLACKKFLFFLGLVYYSHLVDSCRTTLSNRLSDCCIEMLSGVTITVITFNFE